MYVPNESATKAVVSVAEMARMVGLSRARFYQLVGTTFPWPRYDIASRRPFYDEDSQAVCLDARRRNCGIDGKPILFYSRRPASAPPMRRAKKVAVVNSEHADLLAGIKSLGLANVTGSHVAEAVKELYPQGLNEVPDGAVLRAVFLHLRRRNTCDNVGR